MATPLPHLAAGLRAGRLSILAVGSARSFMQPQRGPSSAPDIPWQMAQALKSAYPGLQISLTGRGGRGLTASDMVRIIRAELRARPYQLVLWQTGTVEAVRNIQPDDFTDSLLQGIDAVGARGADLVFIDQQYSRFLEGNTDLDPYRRALERVATWPGVALFRRFALMRNWSSNGRLDLELAAPGARRALVARLHTCLGVLLARFIVTGAEASHP
ncbi:MAG: hypothetical protein M3Y22_17930 [Pseudomonadota bacterium]|nr:hypothetical protein [Pseudomonadota bacterium]